MDFDLSQEQTHARDAARDFAAREIAPAAAELDRTARWPAGLVALMAERGYLGVAAPRELGGAGLDHVSFALVVEELSAACASSGAIASAHGALFCEALLRFGSERQKKEILAPALAGKAIGCFALGEPTSGFDARGLLTRAEKQADGSFVIHGTKSFVLAGPEAAHVIVIAATEGGATAFLVKRGAPGLSFAARDEKMGMRAAASCAIAFAGVRAGAEDVLGEEGQGLAIAASVRDLARVGVAAQALGIARAALEKATAYAKDRKAFDAPTAPSPGEPTPMAAHQSIQFLLADMAVELDAARLLVLRAAHLRDTGAGHDGAASGPKPHAA
jgi:butyryl-CoA dehydrogenase